MLRLLRRLFFFVSGLALGAWSAGFLIYIALITTYVEPVIDEHLSTTNAIVVLTGGSERIPTALALLEARKADKLLISGVPPGVTVAQVLNNQTLSPDLKNCCVTLGHAAADTFGNAEETRAWVRAENIRTLRLVTAHYHMPRSLLLFRRSLPDIVITPHAVAPSNVPLDKWWKRYGTMNLLVMEYNKYVVAMLREWWETRHVKT